MFITNVIIAIIIIISDVHVNKVVTACGANGNHRLSTEPTDLAIICVACALVWSASYYYLTVSFAQIPMRDAMDFYILRNRHSLVCVQYLTFYVPVKNIIYAPVSKMQILCKLTTAIVLDNEVRLIRTVLLSRCLKRHIYRVYGTKFLYNNKILPSHEDILLQSSNSYSLLSRLPAFIHSLSNNNRPGNRAAQALSPVTWVAEIEMIPN